MSAPRLRTIEVQCPECGQTRREPPTFISSICSACGGPIRPRLPRPAPVDAATTSSPGQAARRRQVVQCFHCGRGTETALDAIGLLCKGCGASISLVNLRIRARSSRLVDTRGHLHVERGAHLSSTLAVCGSGSIHGRISGALVCTGRLRLLAGGLYSVRLDAGELLVGRRVEISCPYPVCGGDIDVRGVLRANIVCRGSLRIRRGAAVHGTVYARSILVDRGGVLHGDLTIGPPPPPELLRKPGQKEDLPLEVVRPRPGRKKVRTV